MEIFQSVVIPVLTALGAGFSGWLFGRRKQAAEAVASELETIEKAVAIWREIAQDLKKELEAQSAEIAKLRDEVSTLRKDNAGLLSELKQIKKNQTHQEQQ